MKDQQHSDGYPGIEAPLASTDGEGNTVLGTTITGKFNFSVGPNGLIHDIEPNGVGWYWASDEFTLEVERGTITETGRRGDIVDYRAGPEGALVKNLRRGCDAPYPEFGIGYSAGFANTTAHHNTYIGVDGDLRFKSRERLDEYFADFKKRLDAALEKRGMLRHS